MSTFCFLCTLFCVESPYFSCLNNDRPTKLYKYICGVWQYPIDGNLEVLESTITEAGKWVHFVNTSYLRMHEDIFHIKALHVCKLVYCLSCHHEYHKLISSPCPILHVAILFSLVLIVLDIYGFWLCFSFTFPSLP